MPFFGLGTTYEWIFDGCVNTPSAGAPNADVKSSPPLTAAASPNDRLASSRTGTLDDPRPLSRSPALDAQPISTPRISQTTTTSHPHPATSSHRRRRASPHPESPPVKRMHRRSRHQQEEEERARSSPSPSMCSSQEDDPADDDPSAQADQSTNATGSPPKKKRTRTLTTPHQSAVLHAMLAQSRFPTTAMREEVGKQIGLSARKVQVWFQNQRQKARKPKAEPEAPLLTRPPQFGPYPSNATASPEATLAETSQQGVGSMSRKEHPGAVVNAGIPPHPDFRPHSRSGHEHRPSSRSAYASVPLVGPGVPGPGIAINPYSHGIALPSTATTAGFHRHSVSAMGSPSARPSSSHFPVHNRTNAHSSSTPRTGYAQASASVNDRVTLPPLQFDPRRSRDFGQSQRIIPSPNPGTPISPPARQGGYSSPTSPSFPPPFAIQPSPQWAHQHVPHIRPGSATATSRPYLDPAAGPSHQADYRRQYTSDRDRPISPPLRSMRFDPVRSVSEDARFEPRRPHSRAAEKKPEVRK